MDEFGICNHCEAPISLEQLRSDQCFSCGQDVHPWEIGFMGDFHEFVRRKAVAWKEYLNQSNL